jgi:hypothetical protein
MPIDDRSPNRSYQLPAAGNLLADDVSRLRAALNAIDADVFARYTKTEVDTLINNLIQGAPGALDTLNELAAAMGDDPNFATTITNLLAQKANSADVYSKQEADARYVQGQVQTEMVFIATANQSVFTLTTAVINKPSALVTIDGVVQPTSEYSLNMTGNQLTLSEPVVAGTIVRVLALGVSSQGAPGDDTVTTVKLRDAAVTPAKLSQPMTLRTGVQASGTAVDFNSIPSWAKKLTVVINGISTGGTSPIVILLGKSTGLQTTGYVGSVFNDVTSGPPLASQYPGNTGFPLVYTWDTYGYLTGMIDLINIKDGFWVASGQFGRADGAAFHRTAGAVDLNGVLDRIRVTVANGTDTFDFGQVNLLFQ